VTWFGWFWLFSLGAKALIDGLLVGKRRWSQGGLSWGFGLTLFITLVGFLWFWGAYAVGVRA
jgi:hypothetical protein